MPIKVAIVGAGEVVNGAHIPSWRTVRGAEVIAVCDTNEAAASKTAHRWGIPHYYTQAAEMLGREIPTVVDICTPPTTHRALTAQALEAGCNVLLEKPMAMTLEDSRGIMQAYENRPDRRLKLGIIHSMLFLPYTQDMLSKVDSGAVGDILGVEVKALSPTNEPMVSDPNHWCHHLPGGRFGEGLIHLIYLLCRLLGDLKVESLSVSKRGPHPWVAFDELWISFSSGDKYATLYNSLNSAINDVPAITIYGTESYLRYEAYNRTVLHRRHFADSTLNNGIAMLRDISQLSWCLGTSVLGKLPIRKPMTAHALYFSRFINSVIANTEPPLAPEEAYRANVIFLGILAEIEKRKALKSTG